MSYQSTKLLLAAALTLTAGAEAISARTLTATDGRKIEADVLGFEGDQVRIKRTDSGQIFTLSIDAFAEADRQALREEAAAQLAEAKKPKLLGEKDVAVELSRVRVASRKDRQDIKMSDGSTERGLLELTEEDWGFTITIRNQTNAAAEGLRVEYMLFTKVDEIKNTGRAPQIRQKRFDLALETLPATGRISARTQTVTTLKTELKGGYEWSGTGDKKTRDTLHGIWLRLYQGDKLVLESASPASLASGKWDATTE